MSKRTRTLLVGVMEVSRMVHVSHSHLSRVVRGGSDGRKPSAALLARLREPDVQAVVAELAQVSSVWNRVKLGGTQ